MKKQQKNSKKNAKKTQNFAIISLIWVGIWCGISAAVSSEILLPSPLSVAKALCSLASQGEFYKSIAFSVLRITSGFALGTALGVLLAVATYKFKLLRSFFAPILSIVKSTPVASFIVLLFVWLTNGAVAAFTSALIVLPVIHGTLFTSLESTDKKLLEMARVFGAKRVSVVNNIYIPSALPQFKTGVATAMGLCWKAGIAAEVICSPRLSLGGGIYESKTHLDTPSLFAWTAVAIVISVLIEKVVVHFIKGSKGVEVQAK